MKNDIKYLNTTQSNKYLKRFNAKISSFDINNQSHLNISLSTKHLSSQILHTTNNPNKIFNNQSSRFIQNPQSQERIFAHVKFIQDQLANKQTIIQQLMYKDRENQILISKLKANNLYLKQQNENFLLENQKLRTKISITQQNFNIFQSKLRLQQMQNQYKISAFENEILNKSQSRLLKQNLFIKKSQTIHTARPVKSSFLLTNRNKSFSQSIQLIKSTQIKQQNEQQAHTIVQQNKNLNQVQQKSQVSTQQEQTLKQLKQIHQRIIISIKEENENLKQKLSILCQQLNESKRQIQKKDILTLKQIQKKDSLIIELQKKVQTQQNILSQSISHQQHKSILNQQVSTTQKRFQAQIQTLNQQIVELARLFQSQQTSQTQDSYLTKSVIKKLQFDNNQLLKKIQNIQELQENIQIFQNQIKQKDNLITQLKSKCYHNQTLFNVQKDHNLQIEKQIQIKHKQIQQLQLRFNILQINKNSQLKELTKTTQKQKGQFLHKISNLSQEIQQANFKLNQQKKQIQNLTLKNKLIQQKLNQSNQSLIEQKKLLQAFKQQCKNIVYTISQTIKQKQSLINQLTNNIECKQQIIQEKQKQINIKQQKLIIKDNQIEQKTNEINQKQIQLNDKNVIITQIKSILVQYEQKVIQLEQSIQKIIQKYEDQKQKHQQQLINSFNQRQQQIIHQKNRIIQTQYKQIQQLKQKIQIQ